MCVKNMNHLAKHDLQTNEDQLGNVRDWFISKGSPKEQGVLYNGPLARTTSFTFVLGESGSLVTN